MVCISKLPADPHWPIIPVYNNQVAANFVPQRGYSSSDKAARIALINFLIRGCLLLRALLYFARSEVERFTVRVSVSFTDLCVCDLGASFSSLFIQVNIKNIIN